MKKLEDKIINKVYVFETKRTLLNALVKIISVGTLFFATSFVAVLLLQTLIEKETFSAIDIFQEDIQTMNTYIVDTLYVLIVEIPKIDLFLLMLGCSAIVLAFWVLFKNLPRIKNKIRSLFGYWSSQTNRRS